MSILCMLAFRQTVYHYYLHLFAPLLRKYQLTQAEIDVLMFLSNNPDFDTATDIVNRRGLTKSHVSIAVEHLVGRGYLNRVCDPENRKRIHLTVSSDASEIVQRGRAVQDTYMKTILHDVSEEDRQRFLRMVDQINDNIHVAMSTEGGTDEGC